MTRPPKPSSGILTFCKVLLNPSNGRKTGIGVKNNYFSVVLLANVISSWGIKMMI
jgi:hypothetical protein